MRAFAIGAILPMRRRFKMASQDLPCFNWLICLRVVWSSLYQGLVNMIHSKGIKIIIFPRVNKAKPLYLNTHIFHFYAVLIQIITKIKVRKLYGV